MNVSADVPLIVLGFNARLLYSPELRGWNRYASNLLAGLSALGVRLVLYSDRPVHESHLARLRAESHVVRVAPAMPYPLWEQHWLPRQCARDSVDLLHAPFHFGLPWLCPCPRVLTLHDAIEHIGNRSWEWTRAAVLPRLYEWSARTRANRIVTVSEHAKNDLVTVLGLPASKITVIPEAADPRFHEPVDAASRAEVRARHHLAKPYVFYVGGWEERKNIPFLVRAFAMAKLEGVELVLAGGRDEQRADLDALARSCGIHDAVRLLSWVEDADLPALYAEAVGFVNPSVYEGFGLQLCEAMAVGCPTLASSATSLPQVLGDGGELFDPGDLADLTGRLRRLAINADHRNELARRAKRRSGEFSWSRTAEATIAVYRSAIGDRRSRKARRAVPAGTPGSMPY